MRDFFKQAVQNIARFGDTDIFPFPVERHVFHELENDVLDLLGIMHAEFFGLKDANGDQIKEPSLSQFPPVNVNALAQVGHAGFRSATQLDPMWNAYLLGITLSIGDEIERKRLPSAERSVFSYRIKGVPDDRTLFDTSISWRDFMLESIERAGKASYVVTCDIGDFYPRVYHHRIENAVMQIAQGTDLPKRLDKLLSAFTSGGTSFGLPVGGNAARILAELALNSTDHLLRMHQIQFCRYVDDYHLFASSREEAFRHLIFLSEKLLANDGLSLQKSKTRVTSAIEFAKVEQFVLGLEDPVDSLKEGAGERDIETVRFMRLHIRYDPYSDDPDGDFERTREAVEKFDVLSMLTAEVAKVHIHGTLVKQLLKAAKALSDDVLYKIVPVLLDNISSLGPVFPQLSILLKDVAPRLPPVMRSQIVTHLIAAIRGGDPALQLDLHRVYALRLIALEWTVESEALLVELFIEPKSSPLLRRDIILVMAVWGNHHWLSDTLKNFSNFGDWERRACIIASFRLKDEGKHWRTNRAKSFSAFERLVNKWAGQKANVAGWEVPL